MEELNQKRNQTHHEGTENLEEGPKPSQPWYKTYYRIRNRCRSAYFKSYGGKGIECRISLEEVKFLWFRDKAMNLKRPSIDRIDNDGHYEVTNCRFIELSENSQKGSKKSSLRCINGHLYANGNTELYGKNKMWRKCRKCRKISHAKTNPKRYIKVKESPMPKLRRIWEYLTQWKWWGRDGHRPWHMTKAFWNGD